MSETLNTDWHSYRAEGTDNAGRKIDNVYAMDTDYVIYFSGGEVFYETTPELLKQMGNADVALSRINSLLPNVPSDRFALQRKLSVLELAADAFEMIFCGHVAEGLTILSDIREKLQTTAEGKRRLVYQLGSFVVTLIIWIAYLCLTHSGCMPDGWQPWMLAAALAMAGGVFSVCLNVGSLQVSVNQPLSFLLAAGTTRSIVALLAGIALLLAMRSKMVAALAYPDGSIPSASAGLIMAEMFFCFLAGFSETFVPNILRESEKNPSGAGAKASEQTKSAEQSKTAEEAKAAEQKKAAEAAKAKEDAAAAELAKTTAKAKVTGGG